MFQRAVTRVLTRPILTQSTNLIRPLVRSFSIAPAGVDRNAPPSIPLLFVSMTGERYAVKGIPGETLLDTAVRNKLPIPGTCGGGGFGPEVFGEGPCCRNCHIYVDNAHVSTLPPKSQGEKDLTRWIKNKNANSRFACEIQVDKSIEGMTVVIPDYPDRP